MQKSTGRAADRPGVGGPDDTTSWAPSATGPSALRLVMLAGPDLGRSIDLPPGEITIGREARCEVVLPLGGVSRVHCSLRSDATGVWLRDLGSTNGTRRNGESLPPQEDVQLEMGDLVAVGGAIFKLLDGASPESQYHERVFETMALDGLTQVRNRRALEDALEAEFARSRRHGHTLSLLLVDIDHFKGVNDRHGHLAGDAVLKRIAALLNEHGRRENCTARYGGDEFAVLLAETTLAGAMIFAERVRGAVEAEEIAFGDERIHVTVSAGVAEWTRAMSGPEDLIALADTALYRAKNAGRNRVGR
jgi:two-component system cell cycle response regulator